MKNHALKFWSTYYKIRYYKSITKTQTNSEISFIKKQLPVKQYKKILDFVCGFGRHSIELANLGYNIEGFDIDKKSISFAKEIIKKASIKNIKLYFKDSTKFNKKESFDATICLYSSVGFLTPKQNERAFKNLFSSVKNGGRIVFDVMNPEWAKKNLIKYAEKLINHDDESHVIKHRRSILEHPTREKNEIEFINLKTGEVSKTFYIVCLYSIQELRKIFSLNGFTIKKEYGSCIGDKISPNKQRIIIVADKLS